jgi:hypothetical protein
MSPTWDILAAILSLFPELKELSLELLPFSRTYGGQNGAPGASYGPVNWRTLVLNDDKAFLDSPPADDISDVESEDPPPFIVTEHMRVKKLPAVQEQSIPIWGIAFNMQVSILPAAHSCLLLRANIRMFWGGSWMVSFCSL